MFKFYYMTKASCHVSSLFVTVGAPLLIFFAAYAFDKHTTCTESLSVSSEFLHPYFTHRIFTLISSFRF